MIRSYSPGELARAAPGEISDHLEDGKIIFFPRSPVPFPGREELDFLKEELPRHLRRKNISYHPEADRVVGLGGGPEIQRRALQILSAHSVQVQKTLREILEPLARAWTVATSSFRPFQERGRALSAHASNELVHVDAGAYGATHGNRILRFFMNAHPSEDRRWISKGDFRDVYRRFGRAAKIAPPDGQARNLSAGSINRLYSGLLGTVARAGFPMAALADTSPYDRLMRRFHNYMKDTTAFQESSEVHHEFAFPPGSAWIVFTDMVTHACIEGRHAFIDTFIVPLAGCRRPERSPYHVLQTSPEAVGAPGI